MPAQDFCVVQGMDSKTFTTPPLDGSLTVPELFAFHAVHSHAHTIFAYADDDSVRLINHATLFRAQLAAASVVKTVFDAGASLYPEGVTRPIFGILANADSVTYATVVLGVQQTGATPFPISTRNSALAIAHLLRSTSVYQVFVSEDVAMQILASEVVSLLALDGYILELLDLPRFEVLYSDAASPPVTSTIAPSSLEATALILHSSGTSAFPKPIPIAHRTYLAWGTVFYYGEIDVCGVRLGVHSAPMSHALGSTNLAHAACTGIEPAVYKPMRPPVTSNAATLLRGIIESKSGWAVSGPSVIEEWCQDAMNVQMLRSHVKRLLYAGGPLNKDVGDTIHGQGIVLDNVYGMTETGPLCMAMTSMDGRPEEWEYFRLPSSKLAVVELVPHGDRNELLEPVLMAGEHYSPAVFNTTIDGKPGFTTGDLLQQHPLRSGFYKIYGRADEQIMLSTGEKTNPVPLERILLQDPNIDAALIFGRGRFNNGVLVQPARSFATEDLAKVAEFRNAIWPTVSAMNAYAPAHSRLLKEMILVTSPHKPLELTAKGSTRRNVCLTLYEHEIEYMYGDIKNSSNAGPEPPASWTYDATFEFVRAVVVSTMHGAVDESSELFSLGCDSLIATYIRNNIIRALRASSSTSSLARHIPQTLVYLYPSIRSLSNFVFLLANGHDTSYKTVDVSRKAEEMEDMVAKYAKGFSSLRVPVGQASPTAQETVLITGTTGRLGSHLLYQLIQDPMVHHIYALNRASAGNTSREALLQRMRVSFESWGLDAALLLDDKITFLASDYAAEYLGLEANMYTKIESQLTAVIHNAWRVDFNIALSGFEQLVAGVRRLVDLAIGARFLFVSSVSVILGASRSGAALEEPVTDTRSVTGTGYSESKWVAETIVLRAGESAGLRSATVRVGQLAGDTRTGGWGKQEWVGAMARLGQIVRALPVHDAKIDWVPVDIAATAIIDMMRSDEPVFNLVAPIPSDWRTIFGTFATHLGVPLIKYDEWTARVTAEARTNAREGDVQSLALAEFFARENVGGRVEVSTVRARAASSALANMPALGETDAALYLSFWENIGHLRP